jgi:outer membrane protein OmpA-like peptidoglycan-associated protein
MLLASCSSPPKPPSVDESTRRPVNARAAIDLKACQGDLSRATILVSELARNGTTTGEPSKTVGPPGGDKANAAGPPTVATAEAGNLVAVVVFGLGSASWSVEQADAAALVRRANGAAVIMIRGRTDATGDSPQETALARRRAEAAADFLQLAGVPKDKLRLTWQGAGDPVAGLQPGERVLSRRVEIEFYTAAPMLVSVRTGGLNPQDAQGGQGKASANAPSRARFDAASL